MNLLDELLGGRKGRKDARDFIKRYEDGDPTEGYTEQEAAERFQQVAGRADPDQLQTAATQAFAKLTPDQRLEFGHWLEGQAGGANQMPAFGASGGDQQLENPNMLGELFGRLIKSNPQLLTTILGAVLGGGLSGIGDSARGGAGPARARVPGGSGGAGGLGGILANPAIRAALAGIAAMALKQMMSRKKPAARR